MNARQAAKRPKSIRATSDTLALDGIAPMLVERRATDIEEASAIHAQLKAAARTRRRCVRDRTAYCNKVHRSVERGGLKPPL